MQERKKLHIAVPWVVQHAHAIKRGLDTMSHMQSKSIEFTPEPSNKNVLRLAASAGGVPRQQESSGPRQEQTYQSLLAMAVPESNCPGLHHEHQTHHGMAVQSAS